LGIAFDPQHVKKGLRKGFCGELGALGLEARGNAEVEFNSRPASL
jgi:hypothetical protein